MADTDAGILTCYRPVADVNAAHGIHLVQHRESGKFFVMKTLTVYNPDVYRYLTGHHINGMPEIVETFEQDGTLTVIEEYISGETLRTVLDNGNLFSEEDAAALGQNLCGILAQLHGASPPIVHRDIKPSNIMLTPTGGVRLLDLNAARQFQPDSVEDTDLIGTVGYAAPEQYGFGASGVRTDIYALGVLLCEMVTGTLPKYKKPGGRLGKIIGKCTRIDPARRYRNVDELFYALEDCKRPTGQGAGIQGRKSRKIQENSEANPGRQVIEEKRNAGWRRFLRYLPPGFRTGNPVHAVASLPAYALLVNVSMTFTAKNVEPGLMTTVERILLFLGGLITILFTCNYLDVWDTFRISRIRHPIVRGIIVLVLDMILTALILFFMILAVILLRSG